MPTPDFILRLREKVGHDRLWLSGATAVVLRDTAAGRAVLLVQRTDDRSWTPVSGIVDPGEHPHHAALREVVEETGVTAEVEALAWLTVTEVITYPNGDETEYIDHVFRCRWVAGEPAPGDDEAVQASFFPVDALPPMAPRHLDAIRVALAGEPGTRLGPLR
ncbi:MAG: NUDIX domain-containing protein [Propionicimonas sp.]|nr:NUDIX domain-containing protein [Propionicimonas sp.]